MGISASKTLFPPLYGACLLSRFLVSDSATLWTLAHQSPQSTGFSRQEYGNGLSGPPPGDLPNPGMGCDSCSAGRFFTTEPPGNSTTPYCFKWNLKFRMEKFKLYFMQKMFNLQNHSSEGGSTLKRLHVLISGLIRK